MTDVEVSISRTESDQAELQRIQAHKALEAARREINSIDPTVQSSYNFISDNVPNK